MHGTLQTSISGRVGYLKNTFFSSIRPWGREEGLSPSSDKPSTGDALPILCYVVWFHDGVSCVG